MSIIAVQQRPPLWSPAYNPVVWQVLSNQTAQFKMKYVFDVYVGAGATGYTRFKVPPNPAGYGTIDVSPLVQSSILINQNLPMLSATPFTNGEDLAVEVYIKVGEEYALNANGEVQIYNGSGSLGQPAYAVYCDDNFRPAPNSTTPVVAWAAGFNAFEYYNWLNLGGEGALTYEMALGQTNDVGGKFLTTCPDGVTQTMRSDEVFTLSWLNYNYEAATGPNRVPYVMTVTYNSDGEQIGYENIYNITTEGGGPRTTCSSAWPGGPTGDQWKLQSFKLDLGSVTEITFQQDYWFPVFGCTYLPIGDIFNGFHDTGLVPAHTFELSNNDDQYIRTENQPNCASTGTGVTGWSTLVYRDMNIPAGSVLNIAIPSDNDWGTQYPEMYLWGASGPSSNPANWKQITDFNATESPISKTDYTITNFTTTQNYTALGLRFFASTTSDACGDYGCFSDQWDVTKSAVPGLDFDEVCFQLFPKADGGFNCNIGATGLSQKVCVDINDDNCWGFEPVRLTWLNNLGGRDWYTFIKRNTYTQDAERSTFFQLPEYWSGAYSTADNHPARYGTTVYNVNLQNSWTASTDWLTEEESSWLRGCFASPHVLAYLPGRTEPTLVTITDSSYSVQTYAREKLFQYFVSFVEAQPDVVQGY